MNKQMIYLGVGIILSLLVTMTVVNPFSANDGSLELNQASATLDDLGYASLEVAGNVVTGDVFTNSIGGIDVSTDHFVFHTFRHDVERDTDRSGTSTGHTVYGPIIITKPSDQASILLLQGLDQNQPVEGEFKFFDNDPDSGETRHRRTINMEQGRVIAIRSLTVITDSGHIQIDEISFSYSILTITDEIHGVEYTISWQTTA